MSDRTFPITVVIVSHNAASTIGRSIDSAADGSERPDLIVVADAGSEDGTPEVAERAAARRGIPIEIVCFPKAHHRRIEELRNAGIEKALDGGIVILTDPDTVFGPLCIETHGAIRRKHPMAIGTGPRFRRLRGPGNRLAAIGATLELAHFPAGHHVLRVGTNFSFRKSLWIHVGGFQVGADGGARDSGYEFCRQAALVGVTCVADPGAYVSHTTHEGSFGGPSTAFGSAARLDRDADSPEYADELEFLEHRVTPWYWRGHRTRPILGSRVVLDPTWGAPRGFEPPLHLRLMHSLSPLTTAVQRVLNSNRDEVAEALGRALRRIPESRLARFSPAALHLERLKQVLNSRRAYTDVFAGLRNWYSEASKADRELARDACA